MTTVLRCVALMAVLVSPVPGQSPARRATARADKLGQPPALSAQPAGAEWPERSRSDIETALANYPADQVSAYLTFREVLDNKDSKLNAEQKKWLEESVVLLNPRAKAGFETDVIASGISTIAVLRRDLDVAVSRQDFRAAFIARSTLAENAGIVLGFVHNQPAVFLQVKLGMSIQLKGITYDKFGYVAGYEEIVAVGGQSMRIKIVADPSLKATTPETYLYGAEIDGKLSKSLSLANWTKTEAKGLLGFAPNDLGGAVFKSAGVLTDFRTSFAYDNFGRRMISTQEFKLEGISYLIAYSGYEFDKFGRLSAYSAEVNQVLPRR